jgi:hypothetical protein
MPAPDAPDAPFGLSAGIEIFEPSRRRSEPSVTTRSPSATPLTMLVRSPSTGPVLTLRTVTVLSGLTTYTNWPIEPVSTAEVGTIVALRITSMSSRVLTN